MSSSPADGDRLVIPISTDPPSLDFLTCTDAWCLLVARFVADSLIDEGENLEPVPRLASSWEFTEGGRLLTIHLREGVQWHDGAPFTSKDVVFTYQRIVDPASGARADQFQEIVEVVALDEHTVRVRYREPTVLALDAWKFPLLPEHLRSMEPGGRDARRIPIGTGPFRFVRWERGKEIVLAANPAYFLGRPHLDGLVFKIIPSSVTQFQAVLTGETDWSSIPASEWSGVAAKPEFVRRFQIFEYPALFLHYIGWNERGPFFFDARVRRALTLALDREGFVKKVQGGSGIVAASTFHPAHFGFDAGIRPLPYDPEEAARLLDEAGWKRGAAGGLRRRNGKEFRFTLLIFQKDPVPQQIASLLSDSLTRLGIAVDIRPLDIPALLDRLHRREFEAVLSGWALTSPDPTAMLHSRPELGPQNYVGFASPEMDRLLRQSRHEMDPSRLREIYSRIQALEVVEQPYTFLFFPVLRVALDKRFRGVRASTGGSPLRPYPGVQQWYVPTELQKRAGPY
ncbi:MAG TPA: ABC transporter substrate-binding protein [Candidatus Polarisedimenticolia bacterium]|nr:ABC transporter substrate-binding protein [Candidatus Polarisedimenticolia bacterium]